MLAIAGGIVIAVLVLRYGGFLLAVLAILGLLVAVAVFWQKVLGWLGAMAVFAGLYVLYERFTSPATKRVLHTPVTSLVRKRWVRPTVTEIGAEEGKRLFASQRPTTRN